MSNSTFALSPGQIAQEPDPTSLEPEKQADSAPLPSPTLDDRAALLRSRLASWTAGMDQSGEATSLSIESTLTSPMTFFLSQGISQKDTISEQVAQSSVEVQSAVRSFNRSVDAYHQAPMYVMQGSPTTLRENSGFTRTIEMVGDMRPNLIFERDGTEEVYRVGKVTTVDLKGVEHYIMSPPLYESKPNFGRVNLFNGQVVAVSRDAKIDFKKDAIVHLKNLRGLSHAAAGVLAGVKKETILPFLQKLNKAHREQDLATVAIKTAQAAKREPELEFYRFPKEWLHDSRASIELKTYLASLLGTPPTLPTFPQVAGHLPFDRLIQTLDEVTKSDGEEIRDLYLSVRSAVDKLSDEQKARVYADLAKSPIRRDVQGTPHEYIGPVFPVMSDSDEEKRNLREVIRDSPDFYESKLLKFANFQFEGLEYRCEYKELGMLCKLHAPQLSFSFLTASDRLNTALQAFQSEIANGNAHAMVIEFDATLRTHCKSIVTRKGHDSQGFGRANLAPIWNERLIVKCSYRGLWLVGNSSCIDWARRINNQMVAETVHANLQPNAIRVRSNSDILQLGDLGEDTGRYLDSPDVRGEVVLRPVTTKDWNHPPKLAAICSGLGRLLPTGLLSLAISNPRVGISNLEDFLEGRNDLYFVLTDANGENAQEFLVVSNLDYKVSALPRPADWYEAMLASKTADPLPVETEMPKAAPYVPKGKSQGKKGKLPTEPQPATEGAKAEQVVPTPRDPKASGKGDGKVGKLPKTNVPVGPPKSKSIKANLGNRDVLYSLTTAPGVDIGNPDTWPAVPPHPTPTSENDVGDWHSKEVQSCTWQQRRWVASRCLDAVSGTVEEKQIAFHTCTELLGINPIWIESLLRHTFRPDLRQQVSTGRNWYVPAEIAMPVPPVFRWWLTKEEDDWYQRDTIQVESADLNVPYMTRSPVKEVPIYLRRGASKDQASIFI